MMCRICEKFLYACQSCIIFARRSNSEKEKKFWKETICSHNFGLNAENSLTVADLFTALLTKLHFPSPEHYFGIFFEQLEFFHQFRLVEIKSSTLLAQMCGHNCQNCILTLDTMIWWKIGVPLKSVTFFP